MKRSTFLRQSGLALGLSALPFSVPLAKPTQDRPKLDPELVQRFVGAAHGRFDDVKDMLADEPRLVNTAHDWGGGDFEAPIESASHVGNQQIAEFLLEHGARMPLHTACMLGKLAAVQALLTAEPRLLTSYGAHGFSLVYHATRGGTAAKPVLDYLLAQGAPTNDRLVNYAG